MSTTIPADDADALDRCVDTLGKGSVVVLPVGGVYAIVADAFRAAATQRIFAARRRSRATPLPVLIRSERQVSGLAADVPEPADRLMAAYWPGDLTLILRANDGMTWDLGNAKGTVQLRQPSDDFLLKLIAQVGPLACTAANRLEQPRPTTVADARQQLGVLVPLYLDGGELDGGVSTIVDATGPSVVVHREGTIPIEHVHLVASGETGWGERPSTAFPVDPASPGAEAAQVEADAADAEVAEAEAAEGEAAEGVVAAADGPRSAVAVDVTPDAAEDQPSSSEDVDEA